MRLPRTENDEEISRAVAKALEELDDRPRQRDWRRRAGHVPSLVLVDTPSYVRLDVRIPIGEMRIMRLLAEEREISVRSYLRRALATVMVACDGVPHEELPILAKGGLIWP